VIAIPSCRHHGGADAHRSWLLDIALSMALAGLVILLLSAGNGGGGRPT